MLPAPNQRLFDREDDELEHQQNVKVRCKNNNFNYRLKMSNRWIKYFNFSVMNNEQHFFLSYDYISCEKD